ncbi:MAG: disulfide oxidoreductase, partial [Pseudomonadota bacterium]
FLPALLKPAPTRLRLALWSLQADLQEFPTPPPPGLVTIPAVPGAPAGFYPRAGYRLAGARALRIDMLERLADMIRGQDARDGFEATADMLSITGCTLEQFADLMAGLGYKADRRERPKPAPDPAKTEEAASAPDDGANPSPLDPDASTTDAAGSPPAQEPAEPPSAEKVETLDRAGDAEPTSSETPVFAKPAATEAADKTEGSVEPDFAVATEDAEKKGAAAAIAEGTSSEVEDASTDAEMQVYYVFTWSPRPRQGRGAGPGQRRRGGPAEALEDKGHRANKSHGKGKPKGKSGPRKGGSKREDGPRRFSAGPGSGGRKSNEPDPDSPFAALAALKSKD